MDNDITKTHLGGDAEHGYEKQFRAKRGNRYNG